MNESVAPRGRIVEHDGGAAERRLTRGAGWVTAASFIVGFINYAFALAMATALGVTEFTVFAAGQALLLIGGTVAAASIPWVLASELVASPTDARYRQTVVRFSIVANLALGSVFGIAITLIALQFSTRATAVVLGVATVMIFAASTFVGWLQGNERFRSIAVVRVSEVATKTAFGLAAVALGARAGGALSGFAVGAGVVALFGMWRMHPEASAQPGRTKDRYLLKRAAAMGSIQLLLALLASLGAVVVVLVPSSSFGAANYQLAALLGRVPAFLAGALAIVAFPLMSSSDGLQVPAIIGRAIRGYLALALPFALALATTPSGILDLLFPSYGALNEVLPMLAASGVTVGLIALLATAHQASGRFRGTAARLSVAAALQATGLAFGWSADGWVGLASGELLGLMVGAVVLIRWSAASIGLAFLPRRSAVALWMVSLIALIGFQDQPGAWLVVAILGGGASVYLGLRKR